MPGHFQNMIRSLFDTALWGEVARQRARRTVGYFAVLVLTLTVVLSVATFFHLRSFVQKELRPELGKLPVITISKGVASSPVEQPWIRSVDDGAVRSLFVLDTTGKTTGFEMNEQGVILTRTALVVKSMNNPQVQTLQLSDLFDEDTTIDARWVETYANKAVWWISAGALIARPFYQTGAKLLGALFVSLLGLVVSASARRKPLGFGQIYSIAIYALTPAILLDTVLDVVNVQVPHFWVLYVLIAAGYTALGVYKVPDEQVPAAQWPQPPTV